MATATPEHRFRVALSFPGQRRSFVEGVARSLALYLSETRVLYDRFHKAEFAKRRLGRTLPSLYRDDSELVVVFLCDEYGGKNWCGLERDMISDLTFRGEDDRVMLVRLDSTTATLPDLPDTAGAMDVDSSSESPATIAAHILHRLGVRPDEQLALFIDQLFDAEQITPIVQHVIGDRSISASTGGDALALIRERGAMNIAVFDQLHAQLDDEEPELAPGIDLPAEIIALQERQKLSPRERRRRGRQPRLAPTPLAPRSSRQASHFGLVLDRTTQWLSFKEKCRQRRGDHIFVVHGQHNQDLHLFLERIRRFFDDVDDGAGLVPHELIVIDLEQGGVRPSSADEWEARVRQRIGDTLGNSFRSLAQALAELCRQNAALLVFAGQGGGGLITSPREGVAPLDVTETNGFVDFIDSLPQVLEQPRGRPLRVVVPIEYAERRYDPLWVTLDPLFQSPCFEVLDELTYPLWTEVEGTLRAYMKHYLTRYNPRLLDLCEEAYKAVSADPATRTISDLGEALTEELAKHHMLPQVPPDRGGV